MLAGRGWKSGSPTQGGGQGRGPRPPYHLHPRVLVPQLRRGLCDLGLSPIPCSASPPPPLRPRRLLPSAAQTPIEEFTPTPAFPALQYLESVDEGGVAWRAGLRMGDFLIEVSPAAAAAAGCQALLPAPASSPSATGAPLFPGPLVTNPKAPCDPHQGPAARAPILLRHQASQPLLSSWI